MGASTLQLVLCFLLLSAVVQAADPPPSIVYRMDFREPTTIFNEGFKALGSNDNLYDHVNGDSCYKNARNTAFVATTSDKEFAVKWSKNDFCYKGTATYYYVYEIRATSNFYNAEESLINTEEERNIELATKFQNESEWLAYGGVDKIQIKLAEIYEMPKDKGEDGIYRDTIKNEDYDGTITSSANPGPYIQKSKKEPPRGHIQSNFIIACFTCRRAPPTPRIAKDQKSEAQISIASLLKNLLQFAFRN